MALIAKVLCALTEPAAPITTILCMPFISMLISAHPSLLCPAGWSAHPNRYRAPQRHLHRLDHGVLVQPRHLELRALCRIRSEDEHRAGLLGVVALIIEVLAIVFLEVVVVILVVISEVIYSRLV